MGNERRRTRLRAVAAAGLIAASSCSLATSLDGFTSSGSAVDAAVEASTTSAIGDAGGATDASVVEGGREGGPTDKRTWRQIDVAGPPARHSPRMVYDAARGKAVLFGGGGPSGFSLADTWEWDGTAWARADGADPGGHRAPGFAYDTDRNVTVLISGSDGKPEPWELSGAGWKAAPLTAPAPPSTLAPSLVYDSARKVFVLFGGHDYKAMKTIDATWEWRANGGYTKKEIPGPPALQASGMVFDTRRARTVLFGGNRNNTGSDELWEYDGNAWSRQRPALSPSGRRAPCAAYDPVRGVSVFFGGRPGNETTSSDETWEWDGTTWRAGPPGPPARAACAMAYDAGRGVIVLFGGSPRRANDKSEALADTWIYE